MKIIAKVFKFGELVNTFIGDVEDQMLAGDKFIEEIEVFIEEYLHEHPDKIDNVYTVIKCSNPSFSVIIGRQKTTFIKNGENFFSDQEQIFEAIVKKRLQSGEDEILYRFSLEPEVKHN